MKSDFKNIFKKAINLILGEDKYITYPFTWHNTEYDINFEINNGVEDFRLRQWGGEKDYVTEMMDLLKKDDIFYDIGSSVGLISVIAAKCLTNGTVISFEPDKENLKCLNENYSINNLSNYKILNLAVGDEKGILKLYTSGSSGFSPSLEKVNGIDTFVEVEVETIDYLIEKENLPFPTIVKIDIEGPEFMALKGMNNLLSSENRPRIVFIELHPEFLPSFNTSVEEVLNYLSTFNYSIEQKIVREKQVLCKLIRKY
jgi:FkbM family methyltransferase